MFGFYPVRLSVTGKIAAEKLSLESLLLSEKNLGIPLCPKPLEHGRYVKPDPAGQRLSRLEQAVHQNPSAGCSSALMHGKWALTKHSISHGLSGSFQTHLPLLLWLKSTDLGWLACYSFQDRRASQAHLNQCSFAQHAAKRLHAKGFSRSLFSHAGCVAWIYQTQWIKHIIFPVALLFVSAAVLVLSFLASLLRYYMHSQIFIFHSKHWWNSLVWLIIQKTLQISVYLDLCLQPQTTMLGVSFLLFCQTHHMFGRDQIKATRRSTWMSR